MKKTEGSLTPSLFSTDPTGKDRGPRQSNEEGSSFSPLRSPTQPPLRKGGTPGPFLPLTGGTAFPPAASAGAKQEQWGCARPVAHVPRAAGALLMGSRRSRASATQGPGSRAKVPAERQAATLLDVQHSIYV